MGGGYLGGFERLQIILMILIQFFFTTPHSIFKKKPIVLVDYLMDMLAQGGLDCTGTDNCTFNSRYVLLVHIVYIPYASLCAIFRILVSHENIKKCVLGRCTITSISKTKINVF